MPKLVILDGNSLLYRGFFAMRYLSTSAGVPTNGVFTFIQMLMTILEREKPDLIFSAFDPPGDTFRHQELASYKGTRQEMPDDLKPQCALARDASRAFNVPVIEIDGFEADDVCGTLAERGKALGYEVVIVTSDGDALQLIDDSQGPVRIMITVKGVTDTVSYDEAAVKERYGLTPAQIPDFKGMKGDSSDNLPGVPGIGEKGASKLLQQYGTLENIIYHVDELPDKTKNALITHTETALQCKRLATIDRNVPLPDWVDLTPNHQEVGPDFAAVRALFETLELRTLLKRLASLESAHRAKSGAPTEEAAPVSTAERSTLPCHTLRTAEQIEQLLARLKGAATPVGLQLHLAPAKSSMMQAEIAGVALALPDAAYYISWPEWGERLTPYLQDDKQPKAVYDLKFVAGVLHRRGITLRGVVFDSLLAAYLLNAGRSSYLLADLAADNAGVELLEDPEDASASAMDEAAAIKALVPELKPRLEKDGLLPLLETLEIPLSYVIARLECAGVSVDAELLRTVSAQLSEQIAALESQIYAIAGIKFAIGSTKQLQEILFDKLKLPSGKKTKTGYSTGAEVLEDLAAKGHEIAAKILSWRELTKLKSTYADSLPTLVNPETGKIHTTLSQTVASTGRLSSSNPNLQNIPIRTEAGREIRKAFVAEGDCVLVSADYSQIELRIFAHMTKDPGLVEAFKAEDDIHERTARLIFNIPPGEPVTSDQRRQAKTINFAVLYGASPFRVSVELGIPQSTSAELIKTYLASYPGVRIFIDQLLEEARATGYVQTLLGRRRYVPDVNSRVYNFRQAAEREAANMPVQGTSADIIKIAMLHVDRALAESGLRAKMVLQVHDELLFESPPEEVPKLAALVKTAMENAYPLDIHLRADVKSGRNWWDVTPVSDIDEEAIEEAFTEMEPSE